MDFCLFNIVVLFIGVLFFFCDLFIEEEWKLYDYYELLGKYYGYGFGNLFGFMQGVGWVNEFIVRLMRRLVEDYMMMNLMLDESLEMFLLDRELYVDFSYDNDMMGILGVLGVYNGVKFLNNNMRQELEDVGGFSVVWMVVFVVRIYVEKMVCRGMKGNGEELVRILVNGRVVKLYNCEVDDFGRCNLDQFVEGLEFVRKGGKWGECWVQY